MLKNVFAIIIIVGLLVFSVPAQAQETGEGTNKQVGLGIMAGATFPFANSENYKITEAWGFYVDIPIISTFHISPATTLYRLDHKSDGTIGNKGITDLSINFKFVIPLPSWKIFLAATMGISNGSFKGGDVVQMHVGGNLGFTVRLISNLDFMAMCQYKLLIDGDQGNLHLMQPTAGLQFNF